MYRNLIVPTVPRTEVVYDSPKPHKTVSVTSLPRLRDVDPSIPGARCRGRLFDRNQLGGGFVEDTAFAGPGVFVGMDALLLQRVRAFNNPDLTNFIPETVIIGNTALSGDVKVFWRSYISDAKISGKIELSDITVIGSGCGIEIRGRGEIVGGQSRSEGDIQITPSIMLDNVSFAGKMKITGNGVIGYLTSEFLKKMFKQDRIVY